MESAMGALATLLPKLGKLLLEEYNLKKTVKKGIGDLKAELETMQTALEKVSDVPLDQLDSQVKLWANEVRDLSYVIEDSLDSFIGRVEGLELAKKPNPLKDFVKKAYDKITRFKARNKFVNGMEDIETQIRKVNERFARYKISDVVANPVTSTVDPRHFAMYSKVSALVGIDKAIEELTKRLCKADDLHKKNLKTVSGVGIGGLGKTTVAKALYDKLNKKFDCGCFVPDCQNPDMKKLLKDILYDLDKKKYINIIGSKMDEKQLTDEMLEFLKEKSLLPKMKVPAVLFLWTCQKKKLKRRKDPQLE
ncbi:disease resistance protein RGA5 [Triticum aestivum]|uniref:Rx N-terminal domain-containing protein n=1 Tax=Triticum turgidum subsp. durum TaxID=4567 RepID=A0A9R1B5T5_TRITD|nr:disease resistance protein RGA5-like [Triticum aestivum]VAI52561.1 unnamed protein product [Triticum turgidum subsp. durum]